MSFLQESGLNQFIGELFKNLDVLPVWSIAFIVIVFVTFFTEITTNSVVISIVQPMLIAMVNLHFYFKKTYVMTSTV